MLSYTFYVKSPSFILITCPYYLGVLRFTHSTTPHFTSAAASLITNLPYVSSLHSLSHLDTPEAPRKQLISTALIRNCCAAFHVHVSEAYDNVGRITLVLIPFFTAMLTFLSPVYPLLFSPYLSFHASIFTRDCPQVLELIYLLHFLLPQLYLTSVSTWMDE